jgi:predicted enzyme related to lactoylglutathione lyase
VPKPDVLPVGAPCWVDLLTTEPDQSRAFYHQLFGWESEDPNEEFGGYFNFTKDGERVAGGMANNGAYGPDKWSVYLTVESAKATADAAAEHGGEVAVPAADVGTIGAMAVINDAGGAAIGMWQPGEHVGFGIMGEPGSAAWFELHTREYDASLQFYRDVFGWETQTVSDTPEFRYTTVVGGAEPYAGVIDASAFLAEGVPSHWVVYFRVGDTDAALAQVVDLGGAVIRPAEDTPYGRMAEASDPTGAVFKLVAGE